MSARFALALGALCLLPGCGQSVLLDLPDEQTGADSCDVGQELTLSPLDDFESSGEASFSYYANPDDPMGHTITSPPGADPNSAGLTEVDRCPGTPAASVYALHVAGGGYVTYGPNISWEIGTTSDKARDYSQQSGVAFWARTDSSDPQVLTITVQDAYTFPVDDRAALHCSPAVAGEPQPALGTRCWNGGSSTRTLSNAWRLYTVDFSELVEQTWGARSPGGRPDLRRVLSIEFHMPVQTSFDLWIDDIALFKR